MTVDIAWLMIIANAVIAGTTIANAWALAWYAKKPKKRQPRQKEEEVTQELRRRRSPWWAALSGLNVVLSVLTLAYSILHPNPNLNLQILQIALSVGLAVLALTLSLIEPLVGSSSEQLDMLREVVELTAKLAETTTNLADTIEKVAEAMPRKSPNPTVESDARKDGARGSP